MVCNRLYYTNTLVAFDCTWNKIRYLIRSAQIPIKDPSAMIRVSFDYYNKNYLSTIVINMTYLKWNILCKALLPV